jgi:hypothetical protein
MPVYTGLPEPAKARASEVFHNQSQIYEANVAAVHSNFFSI